MSERYEAAKKRVESEYIKILADTPELAEEHGVKLGDTVIMRKVPVVAGNVSDSFDDCMYRLFR